MGSQMEICILYVENRHVDNGDTLFRTLRDPHARIIVQENSVEKMGILSSVEREDGSGNSFNVSVYLDGELRTFYVRDSTRALKNKRPSGIREFNFGPITKISE